MSNTREWPQFQFTRIIIHLFQYKKSRGQKKSSSGGSIQSNRAVKKFRIDPYPYEDRKPTKRWEIMYEKVKNWRETNESFYIDPKDKGNQPLRKWINDQRYQYNCYVSGKKHHLSNEKLVKLKAIGFRFKSDYLFDEKVKQLKQYYIKHGHCNIPHKHPSLGFWLAKQRKLIVQSFKSDNENDDDDKKITPEEINQLKEAGLDVDYIRREFFAEASNISHDSEGNIIKRKIKLETKQDIKRWDQMLERLSLYHKKHGHTQVPKTDDDQVLHKWVVFQRNEYKKLKLGTPNRLSAVRLQKLTDLGFNFSPRNPYVKWEKRVEQLKAWKQQHGHLRIPVTDPELGEFVARQRVDYQKYLEGKETLGMNAERAQDLESLDFVFQVGKRRPMVTRAPAKKWEERFDELKEYKKIHGHTLVPQASTGLGDWVHKQRQSYKKLKLGHPSPLTTTKALHLADIGFVFDASGYRRGRKSLNSAPKDENVQLTYQDQHHNSDDDEQDLKEEGESEEGESEYEQQKNHLTQHQQFQQRFNHQQFNQELIHDQQQQDEHLQYPFQHQHLMMQQQNPNMIDHIQMSSFNI